jgi:HSP20 family protein
MPDLKVWSSRELGRLRRDMDRLFDSLCDDYGLPGPFCRDVMQVEEDEREIRVRLALPGLRVEDLDVRVMELGLEISGRREELTPHGRTEQRFTRRMGLPCRVQPDQVRAVYREDTLHITLPKCAGSQCRSIQIAKE